MTDSLLSSIVGFASSMNEYIAAIIAVLAGIAISLFAGDLPLEMGKKMLWITLIIATWSVFVAPYQLALQRVIMYFLSLFIYPVLTEDAAIFIHQAVIFYITYTLFVWFFDIKEKNNEAASLPHAQGFSSRPV